MTAKQKTSMGHQERVACILFFTYRQGWRDHVLSRLQGPRGTMRTPRVPQPSDGEIEEEWDALDPLTRGSFMRFAEDFLR